MKEFFSNEFATLYNCDSRQMPIADESVDCVVTSPPYYGLRDYGIDGQMGLEESPEEYANTMVNVFREVWRVLKPTGTVWLNIGDSYAMSSMLGKNSEFKSIDQSKQGIVGINKKIPIGLKAKDLIGIPWRIAFALQADGWYLRSDIIWSKPNHMPESVKDRPTKSHEYIFLLSKNARYYYDADAIKEPTTSFDSNVRDRENTRLNNVPGRGRMGGLTTNSYETKNKRSVWTVKTKPYKEAHFATFPEDLIEPCILAGCPKDGVVLDPFVGSGTTAAVAQKHGRKSIGVDLNIEYLQIAVKRLTTTQPRLVI